MYNVVPTHNQVAGDYYSNTFESLRTEAQGPLDFQGTESLRKKIDLFKKVLTEKIDSIAQEGLALVKARNAAINNGIHSVTNEELVTVANRRYYLMDIRDNKLKPLRDSLPSNLIGRCIYNKYVKAGIFVVAPVALMAAGYAISKFGY